MRSGFFDSIITGYDSNNQPIFDRAENAEMFARYFSEFIGNGVYSGDNGEFAVSAGEGMSVTVAQGACFIKGYFGFEEGAVTLDISPASSLSRIDRVVLRLTLVDRDIQLAVKEGTAASAPQPPALTRNDDIYELALADVRVNANTTSIAAGNITDRRNDASLCGYVRNVLPYEFEGVPHVTCTKSGKVFNLSGLPELSAPTVTVTFTAPSDYLDGDTFTVNGTAYAIQLSNGETPSDQMFVSGATLSVILDTAGKKINFKSGGPKKTMVTEIIAATQEWVVPAGVKSISVRIFGPPDLSKNIKEMTL